MQSLTQATSETIPTNAPTSAPTLTPTITPIITKIKSPSATPKPTLSLFKKIAPALNMEGIAYGGKNYVVIKKSPFSGLVQTISGIWNFILRLF